LGLLLEPTASSLTTLIRQKPPGATILLDPNCRPGTVTDLHAYREMIDTVVRQVDIVKVSTDDLRLLRPDSASLEAARSLLELGPAAVLVTDGPAPVGIHTASYEGSVPAPVVEVVDTIGAGDAFVAGFLTWWTAHALMQHDAASPDALVSATTAAIAVAAANCTVRGATLPTGFRWSTVSPGFAQARDR
jgi:fructokinase